MVERTLLGALDYDSRLGYEPSMEYTTDAYRIEWKIDCTRKAYLELCAMLGHA